jgi:hypothetical protein
MADEPREPTPDELKRVLQEAVLRNYPNPDRVGCPGSQVLKEVANRRLPFEDSHWDHIYHCSPCYREFLDFRREFRRKRIINRGLTWSTIAAAAVIVAFVFAWWLPQHNRKTPSPPSQASVLQQRAMAVLNLEYTSPNRGAGKKPNAELQHLPRIPLALSIYLPLGSEPGQYEIELRKENDPAPLAKYSAIAHLENGLTVLKIAPDLSKFPPGTYVLAFRHDREAWRVRHFTLS